MQDDKSLISAYSERVTKVETQLSYVLVEQSNFRTVLDRQNALLEALAKSATAAEYTARSIIERTEQHSKEIERLQGDQVDVGKVLSAIGVQLNLVKFVGGGILMILLTYIFAQFIK